MEPKKQNLPKVPPFVTQDSSLPARPMQANPHGPGQPPSRKQPLPNGNGLPSNRSMLNSASAIACAICLFVALVGGCWVGFGILLEGMSAQKSLFARIMIIAIAYMVGWVIGLFGMRKLGNLLLPFIVQTYAWLTVSGLTLLQLAIIYRLFNQGYPFEKFVLYVAMFGSGLAALIGIHLLIEKHNLVPFSFPILLISLLHLCIMVVHFVFLVDGAINTWYLLGDVAFFVITFTVGILMLAHLGIFSGLRNSIDKTFSESAESLVPLD